MTEVVVIGAGVIGASVAWHLATLGVRAVYISGVIGPGASDSHRGSWTPVENENSE